MELEGHPTADIIDELIRRGAVISKSGPEADAEGQWVFLPASAYDTDIDEKPDLLKEETS